MGFNSGFKGLIFISPCIVIYSYSTTKKIHLFSQIIYFCKTLYMFRSFRPSSGVQNFLYSNGMSPNSCCYLLLNKMHLLSKIIYSCKTLHMFRSFRPSSGAQNCLYSNGICHPTSAATCCLIRCTCYPKLFILVKRSTCFGLSVHHQEYKTTYTATVYVTQQLMLPAAQQDAPVIQNYLFL